MWWTTTTANECAVGSRATPKARLNSVLSDKIKEAEILSGAICADPEITVGDFFGQWIEKVALTSKSRTTQTYRGCFRLHILPEFGAMKVRSLHRPRIKAWLVEKLSDGYARGTIRLLIAALRAMLNEAVEDGVISVNPSLKLGRTLKVDGREARKGRPDPKALTRDQLALFLSHAHPRWRSDLLFLARTGVRLGEFLAVELADVRFEERVVVINKAYSDGVVQSPKDGESREVDLSSQLVDVLKTMIAERRRRCFAAGKPMPTLLFCIEDGGMISKTHLWRAIEKTARRAGLSIRLSPHCFRHTFASQLLQMGVSPAYVQRQLGHSSIKMTVDTYGKWLPSGNKDAIDRLDGAVVSEAQKG